MLGDVRSRSASSFVVRYRCVTATSVGVAAASRARHDSRRSPEIATPSCLRSLILVTHDEGAGADPEIADSLRLDVPGDQDPTQSFERLVGVRLREARLRQSLSQVELAARLARHGLAWHQTTVAKTELGLRPLRLNEVAALAAGLGLPLELLLRAEASTPLTPREQTLAELRQQHDRLLREHIEAHLAKEQAVARAAAVEALLNDCRDEIKRLEAQAFSS